MTGLCRNGHERIEGNTYTRPDGRQECSVCRSARKREEGEKATRARQAKRADAQRQKVGDVVPAGGSIDHEAVATVHARRGKIARIAAAASGKRARNPWESEAINIIAEHERQLHRLSDPIERAKTFLRRRGFRVFAAEVTGGPAGMIVVGREVMTPERVIARAQRKGMEA